MIKCVDKFLDFLRLSDEDEGDMQLVEEEQRICRVQWEKVYEIMNPLLYFREVTDFGMKNEVK